MTASLEIACPTPLVGHESSVVLAHGEGGRLARRLIRDRILPRLANPYLLAQGDSAALPRAEGPLAFTTDGYVVTPLFFPGDGQIVQRAAYRQGSDVAAGEKQRGHHVAIGRERQRSLGARQRG